MVCYVAVENVDRIIYSIYGDFNEQGREWSHADLDTQLLYSRTETA